MCIQLCMVWRMGLSPLLIKLEPEVIQSSRKVGDSGQTERRVFSHRAPLNYGICSHKLYSGGSQGSDLALGLQSQLGGGSHYDTWFFGEFEKFLNMN